jgi:hypothetical protein
MPYAATPIPLTGPKLDHLLRQIEAATIAETSGNLKDRNAIALKIFTSRRYRDVILSSHRVETWWDSSTRNFVTQLKKRSDTDWDQIGDADYTGEKTGAAVVHYWALTKALKANENAHA